MADDRETQGGGTDADPDQPIRWGDVLVKYRLIARLTQEEAARAAGMKRSFYARCETNRTMLIRPSTFNALRRALRFPGYEMLAAMGFDTDLGGDGIEAPLAAVATQMDADQQRILADIGRDLIRRSGGPTATWPPPLAHPKDHLTAVHSDARPRAPVSLHSRHTGDSEPGGRLTGT